MTTLLHAAHDGDTRQDLQRPGTLSVHEAYRAHAYLPPAHGGCGEEHVVSSTIMSIPGPTTSAWPSWAVHARRSMTLCRPGDRTDRPLDPLHPILMVKLAAAQGGTSSDGRFHPIPFIPRMSS